jgi:diaminopimelate decarboxylase
MCGSDDVYATRAEPHARASGAFDRDLAESVVTIGRTIEALARKRPTPFYVLDLGGIRARANEFVAAWKQRSDNVEIAYSYKSNSLTAVTRLMRRLGLSAEVVSGPELEFALADGFTPDRILFNGPVKLPAELARALDLGVRIQIDSLDEVDTIATLARKKRISPRLSARLATEYRGERLSRFGFAPTEIVSARRRLARVGLAFSGVHMHVGTNNRDTTKQLVELDYWSPLIGDVLARAPHAPWIDIGGGYPSASVGRDIDFLPDASFAKNVTSWLRDRRWPAFKLIVEPGRALVEHFGYLATRVVTRKQRDYASVIVVDAGKHLMPSRWHHPVESVGSKGRHRHAIFGANCFESDLLSDELVGPRKLKPGSLIVVGEVGAYDLQTSYPWIRGLPPVFAIDGKQAPVSLPRRWS